MANMSDKTCRKNQNTFHIAYSFRKSCRLWDNVEKCGRTGQAIDGSTIWRMLQTHVHNF